MKRPAKTAAEIRLETKRLDAWAKNELKKVMNKAAARMVAAAEGKRIRIRGGTPAETRELRRSLRNAIDRAIPMLIPSAPSASAATRLRPSAMPPEATKGTRSSSAARGRRMKFWHVVLARVASALEAVHARFHPECRIRKSKARRPRSRVRRARRNHPG
jgi:hypothetical protein